MWVAAAFLLAACSKGGEAPARADAESAMPVALNTESPFQYPADLFDQGVEGEVRLRLFVDTTGNVVDDSTRVASSSGTPEFDSAAIRGAAQLRFARGRRDGKPVAMAFYQPVIFRHLAAGPRDTTP